MKAELKKTQHPLDIKVLNASAQVLIVLTQSQNGLFNMECSMDPDADCIINIKQDPVIKKCEAIKNDLYNLICFIYEGNWPNFSWTLKKYIQGSCKTNNCQFRIELLEQKDHQLKRNSKFICVNV